MVNDKTHAQSRLIKQRNYEQRLLDSGQRRIPGGMLQPDAVAALDALASTGMSKVEAINRALVEYSKTLNK